MLCVPLPTEREFHDHVYGGARSVPTTLPSTRKLTLATPDPVSVAVAVRVMMSRTGDAIDSSVTTGGLVSTTPVPYSYAPMSQVPSEPRTFPSRSRLNGGPKGVPLF